METIRKTVESKYAPKQTNVVWVDTSGDTPVEKHFIKGKWREMSGGGAGSSNPGYTVTRSLVTLDNESVTTIKNELDVTAFGDFANPTELEEGSTYIVIFDGVEYQCVARSEDGQIVIGGDMTFPQPNFAEYPFIIGTDEEASFIFTENPGTYQVEIKGQDIDSVTVSDDFSAAVEYVSETLPSLKLATVVFNNDDNLTDGFKIYFQKECIYDTTKLGIHPQYFYDNETDSTRITSGNRRSIPEKLFNIDALLVQSLNGIPNTILYKNSYSKGGNMAPFIAFSSVNQRINNNTIIDGSNCIYIWEDAYS